MVTRQEYAFLSKSVYGGQHEQSQPAGWIRIDINGEEATDYENGSSDNGFQGAYYVLGFNIFVRS